MDVVVDAANVIGSRPDGWWRGRAGAAARLLAQLASLPGREASVDVGDGRVGVRIGTVSVVLEGQACAAEGPPSAGEAHFTVIRAATDGDSAVVEEVEQLVVSARSVLVVTADRGLRARLPGSAAAAGPRWLWGLIEAQPEGPGPR